MSNTRILLVDDDRLTLATLERGLADSGYEVETADSGEAAFEIAARSRFDLAVLDIRMPGLSGFEIARGLRDRFDLASLFLSAYGERDLITRAVNEGGLGYLVKPVMVEQLIPSIETAMARARDIKALAEARSQLEQALAGGRHASIAIGILMERRGLTEQDAFEALRASARKQRCKVEGYGRELVDALNRLNEV